MNPAQVRKERITEIYAVFTGVNRPEKIDDIIRYTRKQHPTLQEDTINSYARAVFRMLKEA